MNHVTGATDLGDRLEKARKSMNMSQRDLADKAGLNRATIIRAENGKTTPNNATLKALADATHVRFQWLKTGQGDMKTKTPATQGEQPGEPSSTSGDASAAIKQYATTIPIANGDDMDASPQSSVVVDKRELSRYSEEASNIRRTYMPGDAMKGKIDPGLPVDVRPLTRIDNPGIYVILYDGREMLIRIQPVGGNGLYLRYENTAYEDELLLPNDKGKLVSELTGRVVDLRVKYEVTASVQVH